MKASCGVRKVSGSCLSVSGRFQMVSGCSHEGVRWCQEESFWVINVSDCVRKVLGMFSVLLGRCQMVSVRCQGSCEESVR